MDLIADATRIKNTLLWFVYRKSFHSSTFMAVKRKPKQDDEESLQEVPLHHDGQLEILSEEENEDLVSDDGLVDDFPELSIQSDSDGSEKPKNVVSDITNQPKLVYPEIEPDYDSDSSTEDVSFYPLL